MSEQYPESPFLDYARKLDFEFETEMVDGWGSMKVERRDAPVRAFDAYTGIGEDNPYAEQGHAPSANPGDTGDAS